jgi:hypothetical protein
VIETDLYIAQCHSGVDRRKAAKRPEPRIDEFAFIEEKRPARAGRNDLQPSTFVIRRNVLNDF